MQPFNPGQDFNALIRTAIPDIVEEEFPLFVEFISAYLRFLEQRRTFTTDTIQPQFGPQQEQIVTDTVGGPLYETRKLLEYRDSETTLEDFRQQFLSMFAKNMPAYSYITLDALVRSLRDFYRTKGTEDSLRWFFRVFFNADAEVYYPRVDILRASDASWYAPYSLNVSVPLNALNSDLAEWYVGKVIRSSTAEAVVERIATFTIRSGGTRTTVNEQIGRAHV